MSMKKLLTIEVCRVEQYDTDYPPKDARACLNWFQDKLAQIPQEYQPSATIEISSIDDYKGEHSGLITVKYKRPETKDEEAKRLKKENGRKDAVRAQELAELKRLQEKYAEYL